MPLHSAAEQTGLLRFQALVPPCTCSAASGLRRGAAVSARVPRQALQAVRGTLPGALQLLACLEANLTSLLS